MIVLGLLVHAVEMREIAKFLNSIVLLIQVVRTLRLVLPIKDGLDIMQEY